MKRRVTLMDIARQAGVARSTASMALQNHPRISAKTRASIREIADQLGYRPDPAMTALAAYRQGKRQTRLHAGLARNRSTALARLGPQDLFNEEVIIRHPHGPTFLTGKNDIFLVFDFSDNVLNQFVVGDVHVFGTIKVGGTPIPIFLGALLIIVRREPLPPQIILGNIRSDLNRCDTSVGFPREKIVGKHGVRIAGMMPEKPLSHIPI